MTPIQYWLEVLPHYFSLNKKSRWDKVTHNNEKALDKVLFTSIFKLMEVNKTSVFESLSHLVILIRI